MKTRQITAYHFDNLSDTAKECARDWYRQSSYGDTFWSENVIEDAANVADLLGINLRTRAAKLMNGSTRMEPAIYWSGFSSQGDGACFEGNYSYRKGASKAIRDFAPQDTELHAIADELQAIQRRHFYRLDAVVRHTGHYSHAHSTTIEVFDREDNYRDIGDADERIADALRDFMHWIYRLLEKEWDYQNADEQVDENIRANEYEFDENGNRI